MPRYVRLKARFAVTQAGLSTFKDMCEVFSLDSVKLLDHNMLFAYVLDSKGVLVTSLGPIPQSDVIVLEYL